MAQLYLILEVALRMKEYTKLVLKTICKYSYQTELMHAHYVTSNRTGEYDFSTTFTSLNEWLKQGYGGFPGFREVPKR
jgi:hypothetical protein